MSGADQQRDNDTIAEKLRWRRVALRALGDVPPIVCECYGGFGRIGQKLYQRIPQGLVMDKDAAKCALLAQLRPTWSVYEGDTPRMLRLGAGTHLAFNYLDVDSYGGPWDTLRAFFAIPDRPLAARLVLVVHDGLHRVAKMGRAWSVGDLQSAVLTLGNTFVKEHYGDASRWLLGEIVAAGGWQVEHWHWSAGGDRAKNAHWYAVVTRAS
jgi:hypothetical protein